MNAKEAQETFHSKPWGTVIADRMVTRRYTAAGGWDPSTLVPYGKIPLDPVASVLHYGSSVFEGLKAYRVLPEGSTSPSSACTDADGSVVLFRPELNAERLNRSAERLALPTLPVADFLEDVMTCVSALEQWVPNDRGSSLYVRVVLFASQAALGVRRSEEALLVVICVTVPEYYSTAIRLLAETKFVRSWPGGAGYAKASGNYAIAVQPQESAAKHGKALLWLDGSPQQYITECGVMNLFILFKATVEGRKMTLVTPSLDFGLILPGITRRSVIELVREEYSTTIDVVERRISINEFIAGIVDGSVVDAFGCGTAALITPIESVTKGIADGEPEHKIVIPVGGKRFSLTLKNRILDIQHSFHRWNTVVVDDRSGSIENV
jgi:branched-chain amino acid aminotransferase